MSDFLSSPALVTELGAHPNSLVNPSAEINAEWQYAYGYFNAKLYASELPPCFITFSQTSASMGHFCAGAVCNRQGVHAHEIAINLNWIAALGVAEGYSTLVHEMTHLWRHVDGRPNRKRGSGSPGYHDAVWGNRMEALGLVPSSTGKPGGKRTGYRMAEYAIEGGAFDLACRELLISDNAVRWQGSLDLRGTSPLDTPVEGASGERSLSGKRSRFVCPACGLKAWSRPAARLSCTDCNRPLLRT